MIPSRFAFRRRTMRGWGSPERLFASIREYIIGGLKKCIDDAREITSNDTSTRTSRMPVAK